MDCMDIVNTRVQNQTDFRQELISMGTETPPPTVILPWSCDTNKIKIK
jgi:hypothetical protein